MSYQVLARQWRPRSFETLVGQEHIVRALVNALTQNRLHHAYLFTGTRGVGKTTIARILAKCFNCEIGMTAKPCDQCTACQEIDAGRFIDLIEVDAASRTKVEDTRELLENIQYTPSKGRFKVYIIDEVHMLSNHSFNALLKTLEEPPSHVKFLLATTDPQKLPVTVLSRCLQFHLKNMPAEQISQHLVHILTQEKITHDIQALHLIARAANGSMRDALSLLDQGIAYGNGCVNTADMQSMLGVIEHSHLLDILQALVNANGSALLNTVAQLAEQTTDFSQALEQLLTLLHQIALLQLVPNIDIQDWNSSTILKTLAQQLTAEEVQLYYQIGLISRRDLSLAPSSRSGFEMALLRMLAFRPQTIAAQPLEIAAPNHKSVKISEEFASANWSDILPKLGLTGISYNLATHCSILKLDAEEIILQLDPGQAPLLNDKQKQRLTMALQSYYQKPLAVKITVAETAKMDTPAALEKKAQAHRQAGAVQAITQDQTVQAIIGTFNGTIVPESIKTIDEEQ